MIRAGHILMKLSKGVQTRAPAYLDVLDGAQRAGASVDGDGPVDKAILSRTTGLRAKRCFHAKASLSHVGQRHTCYGDIEQSLGLDRVLGIQIAEEELTDALVARLRDLNEIEWAMVEPLSTTPLLTRTSSSQTTDANTPYLRIGAARALAMEPGSRSVVVAVIDTGVALDHREFTNRLHSGYDTVDLGMGRVAEGVSLVGDSLGRDFCARDETGHGSHVAGVVGANGLSMAPGVAGLSPLIPIRALAAAKAEQGPLFGVGGLSDIDTGIKVAVDMGAKVLNMSFGTSRNNLDPAAPPPHTDALAYAEAHGCICVAAMGNSGAAEDYFPAALPQCIAVGSVSSSDQPSAFSTTGSHVALAAPGEDIYSTGLDGYSQNSGTSFAAPFVAGAAALLASRALKRGHELTPQEAREALCQSADSDTGSHNNQTGWGILNIPNALSYLDQMQFQTQEDMQ